MNSIPTIRMQRVLLRKLDENDVDDIFEAFSDVEAMKFRRHPAMKTKMEAEAFIRKTQQYFQNNTAYRWGVEDIESGKLIGTFLWNFKSGKELSELGYSLHRNWWDRGIMEEMFETMLNDYLWGQGVRTVVAKVQKDNFVSQKVLAKLGFERFFVDNDFVAFRKFNPRCR